MPSTILAIFRFLEACLKGKAAGPLETIQNQGCRGSEPFTFSAFHLLIVAGAGTLGSLALAACARVTGTMPRYPR